LVILKTVHCFHHSVRLRSNIEHTLSLYRAVRTLAHSRDRWLETTGPVRRTPMRYVPMRCIPRDFDLSLTAPMSCRTGRHNRRPKWAQSTRMSPSTRISPDDDSREVCGADAWPTDALSARQWPTDELFSVLLPDSLRYLTH
jgi:hypothetical protein